MSNLYEVLRWINIALYGGVVTALFMYSRFLFAKPSETPRARWWLISLICVGMYGTGEVVFLQQPGGIRVIFMTLTLGGLFFEFYIWPGYRYLQTRRRSHRGYRKSQASDVS